jgi:hypothetical protein
VKDTEIRHAIATSGSLRQRVDSIIHHKLATASLTPTERDVCAYLPNAGLMWAIASNGTVLTAVSGQLTTQGNDDVEAAISTVVPDGDLEYIVLQEVSFLQ